ncbi:hypothetical protein COHCIP112018_01592 [Cohnella sp. JJ-181]|nr:hypothetical protein COHCIP112018_01592 [Cohnella sp. JJ-181]
MGESGIVVTVQAKKKYVPIMLYWTNPDAKQAADARRASIGVQNGREREKMEELRYPIGKFEHEGEISAAQRRLWIQEIAALPGQLSEAARGLDGERLDTPYREGGWTVRQVVHHVGDSHMNCLMRFKLALTEEQPAIKPYEEQLWAELADSRALPVEPSLALVSALHVRWTALLESMTDEQFSRAFYHPGSGQVVRLDRCLGMYVWHGKHHTAHIDRLRDRMGW